MLFILRQFAFYATCGILIYKPPTSPNSLPLVGASDLPLATSGLWTSHLNGERRAIRSWALGAIPEHNAALVFAGCQFLNNVPMLEDRVHDLGLLLRYYYCRSISEPGVCGGMLHRRILASIHLGPKNKGPVSQCPIKTAGARRT